LNYYTQLIITLTLVFDLNSIISVSRDVLKSELKFMDIFTSGGFKGHCMLAKTLFVKGKKMLECM
jgi:hypothetical protein